MTKPEEGKGAFPDRGWIEYSATRIIGVIGNPRVIQTLREPFGQFRDIVASNIWREDLQPMFSGSADAWHIGTYGFADTHSMNRYIAQLTRAQIEEKLAQVKETISSRVTSGTLTEQQEKDFALLRQIVFSQWGFLSQPFNTGNPQVDQFLEASRKLNVLRYNDQGSPISH